MRFETEIDSNDSPNYLSMGESLVFHVAFQNRRKISNIFEVYLILCGIAQ